MTLIGLPELFPAYSPYCNLALKKPTKQSSTIWEGVSSRAADGSRDADYSQGSCMHTTYENDPYWIVDLGRVFRISHVTITNRKSGRTYMAIKHHDQPYIQPTTQPPPHPTPPQNRPPPPYPPHPLSTWILISPTQCNIYSYWDDSA